MNPTKVNVHIPRKTYFHSPRNVFKVEEVNSINLRPHLAHKTAPPTSLIPDRLPVETPKPTLDFRRSAVANSSCVLPGKYINLTKPGLQKEIHRDPKRSMKNVEFEQLGQVLKPVDVERVVNKEILFASDTKSQSMRSGPKSHISSTSKTISDKFCHGLLLEQN